jgi:hypothetical protein
MLALRLPPRVAPQQVVIVPIFRGDDHAGVRQAAAAVDDELRAAGVASASTIGPSRLQVPRVGAEGRARPRRDRRARRSALDAAA